MNAAFVNGVAAHSTELDDEHKLSLIHPGVVIIPAALALAEKLGATGRELITSVVLGYEIATRVAMAADSNLLLKKGFHSTGVCGVFGSTVATAKIAGLDKDSISYALGICGSLASGLFEFITNGSMTKRLHAGWAAHNGVLSTMLAQKGFSGPESVLEGRYGFLNAFSSKFDLDALTRNLGNVFQITQTSYKQYACCSYCHPLMDALNRALEKYDLNVEEISSIEARIFTDAIRVVGQRTKTKLEPRNVVDAQFSAYYSMAVLA